MFPTRALTRRLLGVTEVKTVPHVPLSHPFVERLIGSFVVHNKSECLDHLLFWTAADLEEKLLAFKSYCNRYRTHASRDGQTPVETSESKSINLKSFRRQKHCRGLYKTPTAP